jgi:hypothetical protein
MLLTKPVYYDLYMQVVAALADPLDVLTGI